MLRDAVSEIRLHPGRFVATLLAIAISVGFIVAISTVTTTEKQALGRSSSLGLSKADVVVTGFPQKPSDVVEAILGTDGVTAAEPVVQSAMPLTHDDATMFVTVIDLPGEEFRWAELIEGRWPSSPTEITLAADGLAGLHASVGDTVGMEGSDQQFTVVGSTRDARSLFGTIGYVDLPDEQPSFATTWVVRTDADPATVASALRSSLTTQDPRGDWEVSTGEEARGRALNDITAGFDVFKFLLLGFAGVALVVGIIIISNTFTILVTQRRRQIGLLRAVGASSGQVRGRLVLEALLIGLIGSALGVVLGLLVALAAASATGSLFWGLVISPVELLWAVGAGVAATLISVLGPSLAATRVTPLEALQPVPSAAAQKRIGRIRWLVCLALAGLGIALVGLSYADPGSALVWAMLAGALLSAAVLGAAPLYIAPLLRLLGRVFGATGPVTRLAAENAARNPRRAAATAVALMLAVGLVVTLQVAVATARSTGAAAINEQFPIDISVRSALPLEADYLARLRSAAGVQQVVEVPSKTVDIERTPLAVRNVGPARAELRLSDSFEVADDTLVVAQGAFAEDTLTLEGAAGPLVLRVVASSKVTHGTAAVSERTFEALAGEAAVTEAWLKLTDRTSTTALNQAMEAVETGPEDLEVLSEGALFAGILDQVLNVLMIVLTALLGVAVLIALVGVGNTLGLSVIERQRESALLRALGMQRSGLRLMLLVEALLIALVATVIGVLAGAFFGWLGVSSTFRMMGDDDYRPDLVFSVDPWYTLLLIGVCVLAACLASVLPGRRAANATPTEALAAD